MTTVTLVHGGSGATRERFIAAHIARDESTVVIIEGLAGQGALDDLPDASMKPTVVRIAPGCPCCTGKLTMRVTLNRLLREHPAQLFISLAADAHLSGVINFLEEDQYRGRLTLGEPVNCSITGPD